MYQTYAYWRRTDPEFRGKVDELRARKARREQIWTGDFATFREAFIPREFPTPAFHVEIINKLESAAGLTISMVLCPPHHAKTALMEDWICYKLALDPNHRITVVSKSQDQARKMLGLVQRRMTDVTLFPKFIGRFGPFHVDGQEKEGKPWTKDYFTVAKANHDERDRSLQVLGWTGQIYGSRVDTLILDDIQTRDNLTSVNEMLDKLNLEHISRLDPEVGRMFIVGTRIENGDIYERMIDSGRISPKRLSLYHAINWEGKALWPDKWPVSKLDNKDPEHPGIRQLVLEKAWWCGYQQQPQLSSSATFTDDMMDLACSKELTVSAAHPGTPVVLGIDPGLNPGATAIVAAAYGLSHITVLDCEKHYDFTQAESIHHLIEQYAVRYSPQHVIIETVAFQRGLARDERLIAMGRKYGFSIHEHTTTRNKLDPVMGVAAMDSTFMRQEVSIPWGNPVAQARMEPLVAELRAWRPNVPTRLITQDLVMAFWFVHHFVLNQRRVMGLPTDGWTRAAMPFTPTSVPMPLLVPSSFGNRRTA